MNGFFNRSTAVVIVVAMVAFANFNLDSQAPCARQSSDSGEVSGDKREVPSGDKSGTSTPSRDELAPQPAALEQVTAQATFPTERGRFELP